MLLTSDYNAFFFYISLYTIYLKRVSLNGKESADPIQETCQEFIHNKIPPKKSSQENKNGFSKGMSAAESSSDH